MQYEKRISLKNNYLQKMKHPVDKNLLVIPTQ